MIIVGKEYRVQSVKEGMSNREGVALQAEGPMFMLNVKGVHTVFHMHTVACVELIDREADETRRKEAEAKRKAAWS